MSQDGRSGVRSDGEDALVAAIARVLGGQQAIGDDAAEVAGLVVSVDQTIEGQHVSRATATLHQIGWKALARALSDLAACAARPSGALVALAAPAGLSDDEIVELYGGLAEAADRYACPIVGGDVARSDVLALAVTVLGRADRPLRRSGARAGDLVVVTGPLGGSEAGRMALAGAAPGLAPEVRRALGRRHLEPEPRLAAGARLAGRASAAMDLSDGIAADAPRLARVSGVVLELELGLLPLLPGVEEVARAEGVEPAAFAATAGEDYELLATVAPERMGEDDGLVVIGRVRAPGTDGPGAVLLDAGGRAVALRGFDHRRRS